MKTGHAIPAIAPEAKGGEIPDILDAQVAFYDSARSNKPSDHVSLSKLLADIGNGQWETPIRKIRKLREQEGIATEDQKPMCKECREKTKRELPAFSMSCDAESREASVAVENRGIQPTGILQVDLDHIDPEKIDAVRRDLGGHPSVAFVFLSPSGNGIKAGLCIEGAGDPARHKLAFRMAEKIISDLTGLKMDPATKDVQRLCFVSYDPDLYVNHNPTMLLTEIDGVHQKTAEEGLIKFNRHPALLNKAVFLRRESGADEKAIQKALEAMTQRCTRPVAQPEIKGIVSWVMNKIDVEGPGFDVDDPQAWPDPQPLPEGLPPVIPVGSEMVPGVVWRFAADIAERIQCPVEYPVAAVLVALGSVLGTQMGIRPKQRDDWMEVCNLWGFVVGNPGVMKSPSTKEAIRSLVRLETQAKKEYDKKFLEYEHAMERIRSKLKVLKSQAEKLLADGKAEEANEPLEEMEKLEPPKPIRRRFIVNDPTVEKLLEIMVDSPNGQLWLRDELAGLFQNLSRKGRESDRAFLLECWNGQGSYSVDRIGRGNVHVDNAVVSIFGTIQPESLARYLVGQGKGGCVDDGFTQRFQLALWPDIEEEWRDVDREPDYEAQKAVAALFNNLSALDQHYTGSHDDGDISYLHFSEEAQALYAKFRGNLERHLRAQEEGAAMETHLSKFRGLIPRLALIFHLCEADAGPVSKESLSKALCFAECLESHARRIYSFVETRDPHAAQQLAKKIKTGVILGKFTCREVYKKHWSGLKQDDVECAIEVLLEARWIVARKKKPSRGRGTTLYLVNPKVLGADESRGDHPDRSSGIWDVGD